jgi:nucleotide-binding universal stress UspA family protein
MSGMTEVEDLNDLAEPTNRLSDRKSRGVKEILVPTDLTIESRQAITYAVRLAKFWNAHLTLLHVYQEPRSVEYMRGPDVCGERTRQRKYSENALELLGKQAKEEYANCGTEFREGALCGEIANAVKELEADLVVIGTHGNKWFRRIAYGCDADAIVRLSPCPVLVVRTREPMMESAVKIEDRTLLDSRTK